jgi:hypothetical protein
MTDTTAPAPAAAPTSAPADAQATAAATSQGAGTTPTKPINPTPGAQPSQSEKLAALLKEGGFEVTANGQKHKIESVDQLTRYLQRGIPADSVLRQAAEEKAKLQPYAEALKALREGDDATAESILEQLMPPQRLRAIAEKRLRREFEEHQKLEQLSPRERELYAKTRQLESEKSNWEKSQKELQAQQEQLQQQRAVQHYQQQIGTGIEKALAILGIETKDAALVPAAIKHMRPTLEAMLRNNMPLDPQMLADAVRPEFESTIQFMTKNLDGEALLKVLGGDVSKKVRKALLEQLKGGGAAPARTAAATHTQVTPTTEGDRPKPKVDFRKPQFDFGG